MQEELRKNFVLLSKVAKENKYAQEYLGLLARRGDIGSVRIGKRWYTTAEWFGEFLENSHKKKEAEQALKKNEAEHIQKKEFFESQNAETKKIQTVGVSDAEKIAVQKTVDLPSKIEYREIFPSKENYSVSVAKPKHDKVVRQSFVPSSVNRNFAGDIRRVERIRGNMKPVRMRQKENFSARENKKEFQLVGSQNIRSLSVEERNRDAVPYREIKLEKKAGVFSPEISPESLENRIRFSLFGRLAFAGGFMLTFVFLALSAYFVFSGGLLQNGVVAGARDEKNGDISSIKSIGNQYFNWTENKMRESISISRFLIEAAKEKTANIQD